MPSSRADPEAVELSQWAGRGSGVPPPRTAAPGLVLVAEWGWGASRAEYHRIRHRTGLLDPTLYTYPTHATHVTVATLVSFRDSPRAGLSPAADEAFTEWWADQLAAALAEVPQFDLVASAAELSTGAAYIEFEDPSSGMTRLREAVRAVQRRAPAGMARLTAGPNAVHVPDIVHSSYARFVKSLDELATARLGTKFEVEVGSRLEPFKLRVADLTLANEIVPYMHMSPEQGIVRRFKLGPPLDGDLD